MLSALYDLARALLRISGEGQRLPSPARKVVGQAQKLRDRLDNPRARRLLRIGAEAAQQVAEELDEDRSHNPVTATP